MTERAQPSRPMISDWLRGERRYLQDAADRTKDAMQAAENALMEAHERIKVLEVVLKGIEVYSSSHDDARGMAAKALLGDGQ